MTDYFIHTIRDDATGAARLVIAPEAVTLGLSLTETVTKREPLNGRLGDLPVTIVVRRKPVPAAVRAALLDLSPGQGGLQSGDELAHELFGE